MTTPARVGIVVLCLAGSSLAGIAMSAHEPAQRPAEQQNVDEEIEKAHRAIVQYLEIVTPEVDATCEALTDAHGVVFGAPIAELGQARTAELAHGGRIGVRAPMHDAENPVVRPYLLVADIDAAVQAAGAAGAQIAMPPTRIPGQGTFAIYTLGGIEHGLWQD